MSGPAELRLADLSGRRVVVWGLGREAAAAARAAQRAEAARVVAVTDEVPSPDELDAWTAGGLGAVPVRRLDELDTAEAVLLSPGVRRYRPEVEALLGRRVPVTGGTQLFLAEQGARTVVVTGSKGKSTVTRLTAHLLGAVGREAVAGGNIGTCPARPPARSARGARRRAARRRRGVELPGGAGRLAGPGRRPDVAVP